MLNIQIENFRANIYKVLNNSELLIGTAYYVMKDIMKDLEKNYIVSLEEEKNNLSNTSNTETIDLNVEDIINKENVPKEYTDIIQIQDIKEE